jgi:hypothetical protein
MREREIEIEQPTGPRIYPPWGGDGFCEFSIPEYIGKTADHRYAVSQQMLWAKNPDADNMLSGELDVDPADVGYDFRVNLTTSTADEVRLDIAMASHLNEEVTEGHHTVLLDLSAMPGFEDPTGMNTIVYTDGGWTQIASLVQHGGIETPHESVRPGGHYGKNTILWDIIARLDQSRKRMVALMINKAFAFSSDHPDWGPGLLAGCRWTNLQPGENRHLIGWVFLIEANLTHLEQRYGKARRLR